jgi:hypothetical protein
MGVLWNGGDGYTDMLVMYYCSLLQTCQFIARIQVDSHSNVIAIERVSVLRQC